MQDRLEALLAYVSATSPVEYCDPLLLPGMMPYFPDISSPQKTFSRTGGEDIQEINFHGASTFTSCNRWCRCQNIGAAASTFGQDLESTQ